MANIKELQGANMDTVLCSYPYENRNVTDNGKTD